MNVPTDPGQVLKYSCCAVLVSAFGFTLHAWRVSLWMYIVFLDFQLGEAAPLELLLLLLPGFCQNKISKKKKQTTKLEGRKEKKIATLCDTNMTWGQE